MTEGKSIRNGIFIVTGTKSVVFSEEMVGQDEKLKAINEEAARRGESKETPESAHEPGTVQKLRVLHTLDDLYSHDLRSEMSRSDEFDIRSVFTRQIIGRTFILLRLG